MAELTKVQQEKSAFWQDFYDELKQGCTTPIAYLEAHKADCDALMEEKKLLDDMTVAQVYIMVITIIFKKYADIANDKFDNPKDYWKYEIFDEPDMKGLLSKDAEGLRLAIEYSSVTSYLADFVDKGCNFDILYNPKDNDYDMNPKDVDPDEDVTYGPDTIQGNIEESYFTIRDIFK